MLNLKCQMCNASANNIGGRSSFRHVVSWNRSPNLVFVIRMINNENWKRQCNTIICVAGRMEKRNFFGSIWINDGKNV